METTPQILVVGSDPLLRGEFESAARSLRGWRPILHFVQSTRQGLEAARNRRPDFVCVQLEGDATGLKTIAEEVHACAPGAVVVALYRPDALGFGASEHGVVIEAMRAGVGDFLRRPLDVAELQQLCDRELDRSAADERTSGRIVSIVSNKGGVGKSTISVNVACGLACRHPGKVLLVDVSLHLGSCAPMLDLAPQSTLASAARERSRLDETLLRELAVSHSSGLDVLAAPIDAVEASDIDDESLSRVLTLARRTYDYVVVDTFPMLDGLVLAILDLSERAYVVVQNTVPNVVGGARFLPVIEHVGFPRQRTRVVLNHNFPRCPGGLTVADAEERLEREVDHVVRYDRRLVPALNSGRPRVLDASRRWGFGRSIRRIVEEIEAIGPVGVERTVDTREPAPEPLAAVGSIGPIDPLGPLGQRASA